MCAKDLLMSWHRFLRSLRLFHPARRLPTPNRNAQRPALRLEPLEDRTLPATIGGLVWYDPNANGAQDSGEPGITGVTVTLTWAGRDNTFGNADDATFATTTGADGAYRFDNLPAGKFQASVNPTTLPPGLTNPTFDL